MEMQRVKNGHGYLEEEQSWKTENFTVDSKTHYKTVIIRTVRFRQG